MPGIYLHIPFCKRACTYCDFHFSTRTGESGKTVATMCAEIAERRTELDGAPLSTIYFGGGTPSVLPTGQIAALFHALRTAFAVSGDAEITLEANPDDIDAEKLKGWRELGVNRLSIGIQSFIPEELAWMNRAHTAAQSVSAVKLAQDAGFTNISIDLIYGSRFQDLATWESTLHKALSLSPAHISAYNLTIEDRTALGVLHRRGKEPTVSDELSGAQFVMLKDVLREAGFDHYEISNFGRPHFYSRHNTSYWSGVPYIGIGPSAHSFDGTRRSWNVRNNSQYVRDIAARVPRQGEILSITDRYNEYVMTRLRTMWGCSVADIAEKFGVGYAEHFERELQPFITLVERNGDVITLTVAGQLRADGIAAALFFTGSAGL